MTGTTVSHYRVLEKLGDGGMAVVYKAEDLALGRAVALKFLSPELSRDSTAALRFQHEARTLCALNHPNICTIHETGEHEGQHFLAMELLEGQTLGRLLAGRPLAIEQLLDLAIQIADGLDAAHAEDILHRDIKLSNIFVTRRGHAKILDFGLAMLVPRRKPSHQSRDAASSSSSGRSVDKILASFAAAGGTLPYMSPEQLRAEELDSRTDLFSFGVVLYEMATARRTFKGHSAAEIVNAILNETPPPAALLNPAVPPELDRIIGKALEKDRRLRHQTASDLRADLQRLKRDLDSRHAQVPLPAGAHTIPAGRPVQPRALVLRAIGSRRSRAFALAVLAVGLTGSAGMMWRRVANRGAAGSATSLPISLAQAPAPVAGLAPPLAGPLAADASADGESDRPASGTRAQMADARALGPPTSTARTGASARTTPRASAKPIVADFPVTELAPPAGPVLSSRSPAEDAAAQELQIAQSKFDAKLYDQALASLRDLLARYTATTAGLEAHFLMATIYETRGRVEDAMATYLEIHDRYRTDARAPEGLFRLAQVTLLSKRTGKEKEARRVLDELVERYPDTTWAVRALMKKGEIEERQKAYQLDETLSTSVPASLVTYRRVVERYGTSKAAETALWKLGHIYETLKRFELAAQAFEDLASTHPDTSYDAWFRAAEVYDKKLKDPARARLAYERVPATSPRFKDAQKRVTARQSGS